ncbi:MAG: hypothetical protein ACR2LC_09510 [Pyrinomonadaceae bacterium]
MSSSKEQIPPPTRYWSEKELQRAVVYGTQTKWAQWLGIEDSTLSVRLSPERIEGTTKIAESVPEIWAACTASPKLAESLRAFYLRLFDKFLPASASPANMPVLEKRMRHSLFDLITAVADREPMQNRLEFIRKAKDELEKYEKGLMYLDMEDAPECEILEHKGGVS